MCISSDLIEIKNSFIRDFGIEPNFLHLGRFQLEDLITNHLSNGFNIKKPLKFDDTEIVEVRKETHISYGL